MNLAENLIPRPQHLATSGSAAFTLHASARIAASGGALASAGQLAALLRRATGYALPLVAEALPGDLVLEFTDMPDGGPEAYAVSVTAESVRLTATDPAGLFNAVQTLRQLFPAAVEGAAEGTGGTEPAWTVPAVEIADTPRLPYRGLMLDVARSFFTVAEVKQQIDTMSQFKLNALHLHLTDDQAWRIEIHNPAENPSGLDYSRLTSVGGQGAVDHPGVGLTPGHTGFYTQQDFREIVDYAATRNVLIVPEIDLPGHVNAALAALPQLNPDGRPRPMNTSGEVGYSTLDAANPLTYEFVREVLGQLAAITPGPYLHIGGDEALVTGHDNYVAMVREFAAIAAGLGKTVVGWNEYADVELPQGAVVQYWHGELAPAVRQAAENGARILMSPAANTYLDQKYDSASPIGLEWVEGGPFTWAEYYAWDPAQGGIGEEQLLGVEGPLWTETVRGNRQAAWLTYPRAISLAEVGWSRQEDRELQDFRRRLGTFGERLARQGVTFQEAPDVDWSAAPAPAFSDEPVPAEPQVRNN
ncbi:beta-N-acetylhexosaminidase [Arthrobacter cavernae]|uniref:beta-N-acetylhexosaminidase n=1 Tax=Arthrobacter cavernae TaxID=2817681 RepID=UPI001F60A067|nr:beta-N-acetylhexosaminidase [Arthrobacter cavernae]